MVFLIANLRRIRSTSSGSARISIADLEQPRGELGLGRGEAPLGLGIGAVDHRPGRQHEGDRDDGLVGVVGDAAAHPARVVGDHAAHAGDVGRGRVGPELAAVGGEDPVDVAEHRARLDSRTGAAVLDRDRAKVAPHVDQDPVGLTLAVEARAAGAEGHRGRRRVARRRAPRRRRRRRGPSPRPSASACTGWRRRRSGSGRRPARARGRRRAARPDRSAAAPGSRRRPSPEPRRCSRASARARVARSAARAAPSTHP